MVSLAFVAERAGCALKGKSSRAVAVARNHLLVFRARVAVWEVEDTCDPIRTHTPMVAELPCKSPTSPLWPVGRRSQGLNCLISGWPAIPLEPQPPIAAQFFTVSPSTRTLDIQGNKYKSCCWFTTLCHVHLYICRAAAPQMLCTQIQCAHSLREVREHEVAAPGYFHKTRKNKSY